MTDLSIIFHVLAENELYDAALYYENQSPGLGFAFLREVETVVDQILEHPKTGPRINRAVRRKAVHRFPYAVMYSVETDSIRILAVANQKRRPLYWLRRQSRDKF